MHVHQTQLSAEEIVSGHFHVRCLHSTSQVFPLACCLHAALTEACSEVHDPKQTPSAYSMSPFCPDHKRLQQACSEERPLNKLLPLTHHLDIALATADGLGPGPMAAAGPGVHG